MPFKNRNNDQVSQIKPQTFCEQQNHFRSTKVNPPTWQACK